MTLILRQISQQSQLVIFLGSIFEINLFHFNQMNLSLSNFEKLVFIINLLISSFVIDCSFILLFEIKFVSPQNHQQIKIFIKKNLIACFEQFLANLKIDCLIK